MQALSDADSVTIVYQGRDFPQVIDSVIDRARFRVLQKNKPIMELEVKNGLQAKAKLRECSAGRR